MVSGLGHHIAFIKGITRAFGCHVHGFDQTAGSLEWLKAQRLPQKFHHVPFMLAPQDGPLVYTDEKDGTPTFFLSSSRASGAVNGKKAPGKSLKSIMAAMGHNKVLTGPARQVSIHCGGLKALSTFRCRVQSHGIPWDAMGSRGVC